MRRNLLLLGAVALALLVPGGLAHAADGDCQPSGSDVVCTFAYTAAAQSWTVPEGVTQATFDVFGAQGRSVNGPGGLGGRVTATLSVTPGDAHRVLVGGEFGFNGGGAPGGGAPGGGAAAGGGASDVRTGAYGLDDRLLVAGGGGGAGTLFENPGGDGGHPNGGAGVAPQGYGGGGGTQTAGGAGAFGAGNGSLGQGGDGANSADRGGGGGGGGYYGGGGGSTDGIVGFPGGGGSSYATPAATDVGFENGVRQGDGLVTITYAAPNSPPAVAVAAGGDCKPAEGGAPAGTINLTLADAESDPADLALSAASSDQAVVAEENISFGGTGADRTLTVGPSFSDAVGASTLTVEVSDGEDTASVPIGVRVGTRERDVLLGGANPDMIFARNGDDSVSGRGAEDLICGAHSDDAVRGQSGDDTLRADGGEDTLSGGVGADFFGGGPGTDTATDFEAGQGDRVTGIP